MKKLRSGALRALSIRDAKFAPFMLVPSAYKKLHKGRGLKRTMELQLVQLRESGQIERP